MDSEKLGQSRLLNLLLKPAGAAMESKLRNHLTDSERILRGAAIRPGQTVLEVGSGTGFFTIPAARLIGEPALRMLKITHERIGAGDACVRRA